MRDDGAYAGAQVKAALNRAADDIIEAAELPDGAVRDALDLLVNVTGHYLEHPGATLAQAAAGYIDCDGEPIDLTTVLEWIST